MQKKSRKSLISASQEMSLLKNAYTLNQLILSEGFELPIHLLTYHCLPDTTPAGMALLGYDVHAVNRHTANTQELQRYANETDHPFTSDTYELLELDEKEERRFDVVILDGLVMTALLTDSQLQQACQHLATAIKPGGLLIITTADFDETLQVKARVLRSHIRDDYTDRYLQVVVRDWHGNGYEYTETHYNIKHSDELPTLTHQRYQRRAWRNAELTLALTRTGFGDVQWQNDEQYIRIMTARKQLD